MNMVFYLIHHLIEKGFKVEALKIAEGRTYFSKQNHDLSKF